jgi:hypothetical protein
MQVHDRFRQISRHLPHSQRCGFGQTSGAFHVSLPMIPSTSGPLAAWNAITSACVFGPNVPSTTNPAPRSFSCAWVVVGLELTLGVRVHGSV